MKAKVHFICAPRTKTANYGAENISKEIDFPFVPFVGLMLKTDEDGDFIKVDEVFLDVSANQVTVEVYLEEPDVLDTWAEMKSKGWC